MYDQFGISFVALSLIFIFIENNRWRTYLASALLILDYNYSALAGPIYLPANLIVKILNNENYQSMFYFLPIYSLMGFLLYWGILNLTLRKVIKKYAMLILFILHVIIAMILNFSRSLPEHSHLIIIFVFIYLTQNFATSIISTRRSSKLHLKDFIFTWSHRPITFRPQSFENKYHYIKTILLLSILVIINFSYRHAASSLIVNPEAFNFVKTLKFILIDQFIFFVPFLLIGFSSFPPFSIKSLMKYPFTFIRYLHIKGIEKSLQLMKINQKVRFILGHLLLLIFISTNLIVGAAYTSRLSFIPAIFLVAIYFLYDVKKRYLK